MAPLVTGGTGPGGEIAEVLVPHLKIDVVAGGTVYLGMVVDIRTGFNLDFLNGEMVPTLTAPTPENITVVVLSNPFSNDPIGEEQLITSLIPLVSNQLVSGLGSALGAIPIPQLLGLTPTGVEVSKNGAFMTVFMDLN